MAIFPFFVQRNKHIFGIINCKMKQKSFTLSAKTLGLQKNEQKTKLVFTKLFLFIES